MSIFWAYDALVAELLGAPPTKTLAIKLSGQRPVEFVGPPLVESLLASLDARCWETPTHSTANNWQWRSASTMVERTKSPEVKLERALVREDQSSSWTFQMSTCSGLRGAHANKRRAIDLVRDYGGGHFDFVELKVNSNNPLYATFEVLGYYLAYLQARAHAHTASVEHDVMKAKRVDLVVLGPDDWYAYKTSRGKHKCNFDFNWLCEDITTGIKRLSIDHPQTSLRFERFPAASDQDAQVSFIFQRFRTK